MHADTYCQDLDVECGVGDGRFYHHQIYVGIKSLRHSRQVELQSRQYFTLQLNLTSMPVKSLSFQQAAQPLSHDNPAVV